MNDQASTLVLGASTVVYDSFESYLGAYREVTQRAKRHFERRQWQSIQHDAAERQQRLVEVVWRAADEVGALLREATHHDRSLWMQVKARYAELVEGSYDQELAETFFNSVTHRLFGIAGVDRDLEFVSPPTRVLPYKAERTIFKRFEAARIEPALIRRILQSYAIEASWQDVEQDARLCAEAIRGQLQELGTGPVVDAVETLGPLFFRNKGAYIVGRLRIGARVLPCVFCLVHRERGVLVDAVLVDEDEVSIVFSFTRSYFHIDTHDHRDIVEFLSSILPHKRLAELYISIGLISHGRRKYYEDLRGFLETSHDRFEMARGQRGMVMAVFTLSSYDVVFKIIRDRFVPPKVTTREQVMAKYQFVFEHDRVGRLVDAQEFEFLELDRDRFSDAFLAELLEIAPSSVITTPNKVIIKHMYVERRVDPLNLYVQEASESRAIEAAIDFGWAIKDLAAANIFPGDMFLKNFGVTRHGRVVFYDYDEIARLTECNFRRMPPARNEDDALSSETWFRVGEHDVFPEELETFLGLRGAVRQAFLEVHRDLFDTPFWHNMQELHRQGEVADIFPYRRARRLPHALLT